jgi:hypothetical protein
VKRADDDFLYEPDAVTVGIIIFGTKVCAACGEALPANMDYFTPDRQNASGLVFECRRCRRGLERSRYAGQRERQVVDSGQLNLLRA